MAKEPDKPSSSPQRDALREEYKQNPDAFREKYGVPDKPTTPPPPSQAPTKQ